MAAQKIYPVIILLFILFISCSAYNKNKESIEKEVNFAEHQKGKFTNIRITGHKQIKKTITVFIEMKDSVDELKLDTITFGVTGDGFVTWHPITR